VKALGGIGLAFLLVCIVSNVSGQSTNSPGGAFFTASDGVFEDALLVARGQIFQNVILPGKTHLTAIAVGGPMPPQYIESMSGFIEIYDGFGTK